MGKLKTAMDHIQQGDFRSVKKKILKNVLGQKRYKDSEFRNLVDETEIKPKFERALQYLKKELDDENNLGDYLEFGVSHGSSMLYMFDTLKKLQMDNVRLFGFDSFEGLPEEALYDDDGIWRPGDFYAKEKNVRKFLTRSGIDWNRVILTKGWFKDTLEPSFIEQHNIDKASVIMIDCDIYSAAKEALNFCTPLIKDKTIIVFDDWNSSDLASKNLGEKKAFDEFLVENPQFESTDFDSYSFKGIQNGEIKLVTLK